MHALAMMLSQLKPSKPKTCFSSSEKHCSKKPRRLSLHGGKLPFYRCILYMAFLHYNAAHTCRSARHQTDSDYYADSDTAPVQVKAAVHGLALFCNRPARTL